MGGSQQPQVLLPLVAARKCAPHVNLMMQCNPSQLQRDYVYANVTACEKRTQLRTHLRLLP